MPVERMKQGADKDDKRFIWRTVITAALFVAVAYLLFGFFGPGLNPGFWVVFFLLAVTMIAADEGWRRASRAGDTNYETYRQTMQVAIVIVLVVTGLWKGDWGLLAFGAIVAALVANEFRHERSTRRHSKVKGDN